jgi:3'-5' exoribonuclease-like protein
MQSHIMLDLETFGTKAGCVLRSIGAVQFDIKTGRLGAEFYRNIDRASCEALGMTVDPETVAWWNKPGMKDAQNSLAIDQRPFEEVATDFCKWYVQQCKGLSKVALWSQGSNFDGVLLEHSLVLAGLKPPWKFYHAFDTRTAYFMGDLNTFNIKREGTYHNALADAKHQAMCVHRAYSRIVKGGMM